MLRRGLAPVLVVLVAACGRTALQGLAERSDAAPDIRTDAALAPPDLPPADTPAADEPRRDSLPSDPPPAERRDSPADIPRELLPELPTTDGGPEARPRDVPAEIFALDLPDAERAPLDSPVADLAPVDASPPSGGCGALKPLADQGVLRQVRSRDVTFASDRSWIALTIPPQPGTGDPDHLLRIDLPSGKGGQIDSSGATAEALGPNGGMLLVGANGDPQRLAVYENDRLRELATGVCGHRAAPDGAWLYVVRDCPTRYRGTLEAVEVATGTAKRLATDVRTSDLAVSPNGAYVAFVVGTPDAGSSADTLHLAAKAGEAYAIASQPGARDPYFVANNLLVFTKGSTGGYPAYGSEIVGHVPGTGDTSYLVANGRGPGLFGYRISADRAWLLGAAASPDDGSTITGLLYAIRLDGGEEHLLSSSLVAFWLYEMAIDAFAWSGDGQRAIFLNGGLGRASTWTSTTRGESPRQIATGSTFRAAPIGDQVALLEDGDAGRLSHLRVVALGTGSEIISFSADGSISAPAFTPDARGLLFVTTPATGTRQLRYISPALGGSVVLGEWTETELDMHPGTVAGPPGAYPIDPTGCFTVVDTDLAPGPGTRLVLLPG